MPTVNIKNAPYNATGDGILATRTLTTSGTTLTATISTWAASNGDAGKVIVIEGAGTYHPENNPLAAHKTTITASTTTTVTLASAPPVSLSGVTTRVEWGHDDSAAFVAFHAAYVGVANVVLNIPDGRYCFYSGAGAFCAGIPSLKIVALGSGAWFTDMLYSGGWFLGAGLVLVNDIAHHARIATAAQGAYTLTLLSSGSASLFAVNTYALLTGYALQSYGYPSNPWRRQWIYITGISGTTITLRDPLRYSFLSTWPNYSAAGPEIDQGGPATLYQVNQNWDCDHEYIGLNFYSPHTLFNANGRKIKFTGGTAPLFGPNISLTDDFSMSGFTVGSSWEIDKINNVATISNSTALAIHCQSASADIILDNVTLTSSGLNGTPNSLRATGCTIANALLGPTSYGATSSVYFKDCAFAAISSLSADTFSYEDDVFGGGGYSYDASTGIISRLKSAGTGEGPAWANPGNWVIYQSGSFYQGTFLVTDVYEDGTSVHIATNLSGAFPSPVAPNTQFTFRTHPAVDATFINCTGDYKAVAWSKAPARHILYSHWDMTYIGNILSSAGRVPIIGEVVSITVTIAGYSAGTLDFDGPFVLSKSGGTSTQMTWTPVFDLGPDRTVVITRAGVTGGGASADQNLTLPGSDPIWMTLNQMQPKMTGAVGAGTVRIVIETDQGIAPRAVMQRRRMFGIADGVPPANYYVPGNVDPAMSTSDYYHQLGALGFRPYDLTKWGSQGSAIAAARGRYLWLFSSDHPSQTQRWRDDSSWRMGFTSDPGIPPDPSKMIQVIPQTNNFGGPGFQPSGITSGNIYHASHVAYNPSDPDGLWFYHYGEGTSTNPVLVTHIEGLHRSADLVTWVPYGFSHFNDTVCNNTLASYQDVVRRGAGDWYSISWGSKQALAYHVALWTSTDGRSFTLANPYTQNVVINAHAPNPVVTAHFTITAGDTVASVTCTDMDLWTAADIGKDIGFMGTSDGGASTNAVITGFTGVRQITVAAVGHPWYGRFSTPITNQAIQVEWQWSIDRATPIFMFQSGGGGADDIYVDGTLHKVLNEYPDSQMSYPAGDITNSQYLSLVPIHEQSRQILSRTRTDFIRLTAPGEYIHSWPGPEYLQARDGYAEDGILHVWGARGYISEINVPYCGKPLGEGGSAKHQWRDYITYIYDHHLAVTAAPVGVTASCAGGVVTVSWYDALPQKTYRVYQGTTSATQATLVGDVVGTSLSFTPTSLNAQCWVKVVTISGTAEKQSRVVHCYASSAAAFVNAHINRVIDDGGDFSTIDVTFCNDANAWLEAQNLKTSLLHFADARCGVKQSGGHVVKIYDLGTTYLPRGRDLWTLTSNTTYSATSLSGKPAWTNPGTSDYLAFGGAGNPNDGTRFNQIRMKKQITVAALYQRTDTSVNCTFLGTSTSTSSARIDAILNPDPGGVPNYNGEGPGLSLTHVAGTPGTISFKLRDESSLKEATVAASGASVQVAIGSYDGSNMVAYSDAVAGSPNSSYSQVSIMDDTVLNGARVGKDDGAAREYHATTFLCSGSKEAIYRGVYGGASSNPGGDQYYNPLYRPGSSSPPDRVFGQTEAKFRSGGLVVLGKGITSTQAGQLKALLLDEDVMSNWRTVVSWAALSGSNAVTANWRTIVSWAALSGNSVVAVSSGTGALASARASLAGFQGVVALGSGALAAQRFTLVASGASASAGSGTLVARRSTIFGMQATISPPPQGRIMVVHASSRVIEADNRLMAA